MFPLAFRSQSFNSIFKTLSKRILKFHFFSGRNKLSLSNFLLGILLHLEVFRNRVEQVCRVSGSEKLAHRDSRYVSESRCCELNILFKKSEMREACCWVPSHSPKCRPVSSTLSRPFSSIPCRPNSSALCRPVSSTKCNPISWAHCSPISWAQ